MKKTVVITGANSGIGKEAAIQFAERGFGVVMACRDLERSELVRREIMEKTGSRDVELFCLDISSKGSIEEFCRWYGQTHDTLDILINNAGHFKHGESRFQPSVDGVELTFATNLLGPVLLCRLLADVLEKSKDPRILNACSTNIKHFFDERRKIDFQTLRGEQVAGKSYDSYKLYGDSKMGLLMATFTMAEEFRQKGISVNAIMIPATKMSENTVKKMKSFWKILAILQQPFAQKTEIIGKAYVSICTEKCYDGVTGKLMNHFGGTVKAADSSVSFFKVMGSGDFYPAYGDDEEAGKRIWEMCGDYGRLETGVGS